MKAMVVVGALALALVASSALAQNVVRKYQIGMQVDVDAHGQVAHVGTPDGVPQALVNAVRQTASHWRFKPIQVGGRPASASTWVHATVQVVQRADGRYGVQVIYGRNGPKLPLRHMMPMIPPPDGDLSLQVAFEVKPDGSLQVLRLLKHDGRGYRRMFKATRQAIQSSHAVPMRVAGKAVTSKIQMTFGWCLEMDCRHAGSGDKHATAPASPTPSRRSYAVDNALQFLPAQTHAMGAMQKTTSG